MKRILIFITIITSILFSNDLLEVTLESNSTTSNRLNINMTITNLADEDIQIDESTFPFIELDITRNMFNITEDGKALSYQGILLKGEPLYRTLAAGESHTTHVALEKFYTFQKGIHQYNITYSDKVTIKINGLTKTIPLLSNDIEVEEAIKNKKKVSSIRSATCSSIERSAFNSDVLGAKNVSLKAQQTLQSYGYNHSSYRTWFGAGNSGYLNTVYVNFRNIYNATNNVQPACQPASQYYCSSEKYSNTIAYVYPTNPNHEINLCPRYWDYSNTRQAAIIVHELSHFLNVANTNDGDGAGNYLWSSGTQYLAQYYPHLAIQNSYSYDSYAEELLEEEDTGDSSSRYFNFNNRSNTEGWQTRNLRDAYNGPYNGAWFFQASYNDPQVYSPSLNINANVIKKITIRMANAFNPAQYNRLQVFWKGSGQGFSEANSQSISVHNHGGWVTYTIDLSQNPRWAGNIEQIRIDPILAGDGHWIAIDYIHLTR